MKAFIVFVAIGVLSMVSAANGKPLQCQAGMRKALMAGHFDTPIICSPANARLVLAGRTTGNGYAIYDYFYRFLTHAGGVMHGDERLVVFQRGRYVGQYTLSAPNIVTVRGTKVIVTNKEDRERDVLDFSKGPPKEALLDGYREGFGR